MSAKNDQPSSTFGMNELLGRLLRPRTPVQPVPKPSATLRTDLIPDPEVDMPPAITHEQQRAQAASEFDLRMRELHVVIAKLRVLPPGPERVATLETAVLIQATLLPIMMIYAASGCAGINTNIQRLAEAVARIR